MYFKTFPAASIKPKLKQTYKPRHKSDVKPAFLVLAYLLLMIQGVDLRVK